MVEDGRTRRRRLCAKRSRVADAEYSRRTRLADRPVRDEHSPGIAGVHFGSDAKSGCGPARGSLKRTLAQLREVRGAFEIGSSRPRLPSRANRQNQAIGECARGEAPTTTKPRRATRAKIRSWR